MTKTTTIYALKDPRTGEIRYVGKADNPTVRLQHHSKISFPKTHKEFWIVSLREVGLKPALEILDVVPRTQWKFWESEYIRVFRAIGFRLTNLSNGGEGQEGYRHTDETRNKIRKSMLGRKASDKTRALMSLASKAKNKDHLTGNTFALGHRHSEETRRKMSLSHTGKPGPNAGKKFPNRRKPL